MQKITCYHGFRNDIVHTTNKKKYIRVILLVSLLNYVCSILELCLMVCYVSNNTMLFQSTFKEMQNKRECRNQIIYSREIAHATGLVFTNSRRQEHVVRI